MATTRLMPLATCKGRTVSQGISDIICNIQSDADAVRKSRFLHNQPQMHQGVCRTWCNFMECPSRHCPRSFPRLLHPPVAPLPE